MFTLTTTAAQRIRDAADQGDAAGMALRVAARRAADGSIEYGMGFDDAADGEVPALQADGVTVLIAPSSQPLLDGTTLDFVELEPGQFSFIFIPPTASNCGSGASSCGSGRCSSGGCGGSDNTTTEETRR